MQLPVSFLFTPTCLPRLDNRLPTAHGQLASVPKLCHHSWLGGSFVLEE